MVKFSIQNDIWKYSETNFLPVGWRHRLQIARNDVCTNLFFFFFFCMNFVFKISQQRNQQSSPNFHSIFAMIRNGYNNLFSLITQPWRHLGAILWFHFIIHIFITIHQKLTNFSTHKLPAIV